MMTATKEGCVMLKKYIVRLTDAERRLLGEVVGRFKGSSQKVRRAQVLLKADADGPAWTDAKIAEAFGCRSKTVENIRERFVKQGFEVTLDGQKRSKPPRAKLLDGKQEAKIMAMRLGSPPPGFANWSLRLLAEQVVALEIAPSISHETVRRTLKKTA
jgi:transposase